MFRANSDRYLIKTPTGFEKFAGIQKKIVPDLYTFSFIDGTNIKFIAPKIEFKKKKETPSE